MALAPLVHDAVQDEWEAYSVAHQGWLKESYQAMGWEQDPYPIQGSVYEVHDTGLVVESSASITMPLWQRSEPPKDTGIINFNLLSNDQVKITFDAVMVRKEGAIGPVMDVSAVLGTTNNDDSDTNQPPSSLFIQPVLEPDRDISFEDNESPSVAIVATLIASILWDKFYSNLYHNTDGGEGMIIVTKASCSDQEEPFVFSYQLHGDDPVFLGLGDWHDPHYNNMMHHTTLSGNQDAVDSACQYVLAIYPSAMVEASNTSNEPIIFTMVMVMLFVATAVGFIIYDFFVQRRQREATAEMARSNAIVSSLFPAEIRDRLLADDDDSKKKSTSKDGEKHGIHPGTQKVRLQNFLDEEGEAAEKNKAAARKMDGVILDSKPIADLFPNTTVLFADIAGFTAWSSVREPSQVFTLLETVYKAFDKTAKRRKVFKVETVGDCYVSLNVLPAFLFCFIPYCLTHCFV
jgi:hypothetical protein